jgi:ABC-2 type transport system ATP-binding protein
MEQAEKICDQLCIIARGRKLVDGPLSEVKQRHGGRHLSVAFDGARGDAQVFADRRSVAKAEDFGQYVEAEITAEADPQEILRALLAGGARISKFELAGPSLHKVFVDLVGAEATVAAAVEDQGA